MQLSRVVVLFVSEAVTGSHIWCCFYGTDTIYSKYMLHFNLLKK